MGSKQSINIETPPFKPEDWEYVGEEEEIPEDYGLYRTLRHRKTGEKVDEYEFMWGNEEEFLYYLKSYNWRSRQENIVNSRFLVQKNKEEICSYSYMASVYIEHIKLRLSEINDIPFPDNLYMLMEALEGYACIYEHSKYFIVEENQICVDQLGNVKVWVNGDLSMNYPSIIVEENERMGQEEMVDAVISMIADNTDYDTEPKPSFREYYYQKKKGSKGKKFDEARNLVFSYARLNNTEIPSRFEAIFNITNDDIDIRTYTQQSVIERNNNSEQEQHNPFYAQPNQQIYTQPLGYKEPVNHTALISTSPNSHVVPPYFNPPMQYSFGSKSQQQLVPLFIQRDNFVPAYVESERLANNQIPLHMNPQSIYRPNVILINDGSQRVNATLPNTHSETSNQQVNYFVPNPNTQIMQPQYSNMFNSAPHFSSNSNFVPPRLVKKFSTKQENIIFEQAQQEEALQRKLHSNTSEMDNEEQFEFAEESKIDMLNSNVHKEYSRANRSNIPEQDDQVAKSLPIDGGVPSFNKRNLSSMAQNDKAVLSHIETHHCWPNNFGERQDNSRAKTLAQMSQQPKKNSVNPLKYFFSLHEELEIDPVIAADLARLT